MPWTDSPKVVELRRRHRPIDVVVETLDGFRRHLSGRNSAVLTYYGFLTLFPLFLAAATIAGFVLQNRPELQEELVEGAAAEIPFIGDQLGGEISGNWWALIIGLLIALWGSMKAFIGLQIAYDDVWEIHVDDRAKFLTQRVRALIGLGVIGLSQIGTVALAALVSSAGLPRLGQLAIAVGQVVINMAVLAAMYRFMTSATTTWSNVLPGSVFAGLIFTLIQLAGTRITAALAKSDNYGEFASVLALLAWLSIFAIVNLYGAELNAALVRLRTGRTAEDVVDMSQPG